MVCLLVGGLVAANSLSCNAMGQTIIVVTTVVGYTAWDSRHLMTCAMLNPSYKPQGLHTVRLMALPLAMHARHAAGLHRTLRRMRHEAQLESTTHKSIEPAKADVVLSSRSSSGNIA